MLNYVRAWCVLALQVKSETFTHAPLSLQLPNTNPTPTHLHPGRPVEPLPKVAPRAAAGQRARPVVRAGRHHVRAVSPELGLQVAVGGLFGGLGFGGEGVLGLVGR